MTTANSMLGKWDPWYKDVKHMTSFRYGNTVTYQKAEDFLRDLEIEDWGCGTCAFKRLHKGGYRGIDGSQTPFVDTIADLTSYTSNVDGIMMRHVLEHNYDWKRVLQNALNSFRKKLCLILFTPFADTTREIAHNKKFGVDAPTLSFAKKDLETLFQGFNWKLEENIPSSTFYGKEHIYYIERKHLAVLSANLSGFDLVDPPPSQTLKHDYFLFTDDNFPPRFNSMTPRLQAKIPKFFGWQMAPGYEYYFWIDGNLRLTHPDSLKYFYDQCQGYDVVVFKHPKRNTIVWEARYVLRGLKQGSRYIYERYAQELVAEQLAEIKRDTEYVDDLLVNGGVFMYRNTPAVQAMLKEWWYHVSRYFIMDQCSFAYVLKKSGVKVNALPENLYTSRYVSQKGHVRHA